MLVKYNNLAFSEFKTGCSIGFMPCFFAIIQVIPENKQCHRSSGPTMKQTDRPLDLLIWGLPKPTRTQLPVLIANRPCTRIRGQSLT